MDLPKRKLNRLKDYDYSQNGAYFVTICTKDKKCLFGNIVGATCGRPIQPTINLSSYGTIVNDEFNKIHSLYESAVTIDKYVIMPNHVHFIISLQSDICGRPQVAPTISRVINQFKGSISKQAGFSLWQKSFYDHIIRNESEYLKIWEYIDTNPLKWEQDEYYAK